MEEVALRSLGGTIRDVTLKESKAGKRPPTGREWIKSGQSAVSLDSSETVD
jgi:hypothetical protein